MSLELQGKIVEIYDTVQVKESFAKREFVIEMQEENNNKTYTSYAKLQVTQARCDTLNAFSIGQSVKVQFNVKGFKYEKDGKVNYGTNLEAWKIEGVGNTNYQAPAQSNNVAPSVHDQDVPF